MKFEGLAQAQGLKIPALLEESLSQLLSMVQEKTGVTFIPKLVTHVTVISIAEKKFLRNLEEADFLKMKNLLDDPEIEVTGVGCIDGASLSFKLRDVDKAKKTCFVCLNVPKLNVFREGIGLPRKDFHVTIGVINGDIHYQIIGEKPIKVGGTKMKVIKGLIPKKPSLELFPQVTFGKVIVE